MLNFQPLYNEVDPTGGGGGGGSLMGGATTQAPPAQGGNQEGSPAPVTPANQAPVDPNQAPTPILNETGGLNVGWYKGTEVEQFGKQLDKFNSVEGLAKGYSLLEKNRMVPQEGSDEAAIATFRAANNIPATHEEYEINVPEQLPDGVTIPEESLAQYKQMFHDANITPHQAQKLFDSHLSQLGEQSSLLEAQAHDNYLSQVSDLKGEWGNSYEAKLQSAENAFSALAAKAGVDTTGATFLTDPIFVKMMHAASGLSSEAPVKGIGGSTPSMQGSKQEAISIMTDVNHRDYAAFHNPSDPRHIAVQDSVARMNK
ncbi:hypothetical protein OAI07_01320 [Akkermansiaceae bacterium]|nr:hypothetical protein [Akkermansiaceae bacterium]